MTRRDYIAIAVIGVITLAIGLWGWKAYAPSTPGAATSTTSTTATPALEYTKTKDGDREHKETTQYYTIDIVYPDSVGLTASAGSVSDAAAERTMESFISDQIAQFKSNQNFDNLTPEDKKMLGFDDGRTYDFEITYEKKESPKTTSIVFTVYADTGGAHPNTTFQTFTWNKDGKQLLLGDLFTPGKPYLTEVAAIAKTSIIKDVESRGGTQADLFMDGLQPTDDNFANFFLVTGNLVIIFPPYQVAPYAAGTLQANIPLTSLTDLRSQYK